MTMPAIEILGLEKTYLVGFCRKRPKRALSPLRLEVEEGEIFGFLGPNGAGKTTTLKLLMGLVFPTSGSARILGREWTDPQVKAQIGFLPEQPYFYDHLTAHELLNYYGQLSGVPGNERSRRVETTLQRVGLPDVQGVQLRKFSKGMLQRAGIDDKLLLWIEQHKIGVASGRNCALALETRKFCGRRGHPSNYLFNSKPASPRFGPNHG